MKTHLQDAHIIRESSSELPFQVWATATDLNDTSRAASAYICSTDDKDNAQLVVEAINSRPAPRVNGSGWSPACDVTGCIDYNKTTAEALKERGEKFPKEKAPAWDAPTIHDRALFHLHPFNNYVMGPVQVIPCGCEIRGGGNLISPLHIHYCATHAPKPTTQGE